MKKILFLVQFWWNWVKLYYSHGYNNFTKFHQNRIKNSPFFVFLIHLFLNSLIFANSLLNDSALTQCSKIRKKCNFKSTKTHFLQFQKWLKINFFTRKKFNTTRNLVLFQSENCFLVVLNFFPVQKLIFVKFWNCKKWNLVKKKFHEKDLFDFTSFFALDFLKLSGQLCL